jgi:hypothetical protein
MADGDTRSWGVVGLSSKAAGSLYFMVVAGRRSWEVAALSSMDGGKRSSKLNLGGDYLHDGRSGSVRAWEVSSL